MKLARWRSVPQIPHMAADLTSFHQADLGLATSPKGAEGRLVDTSMVLQVASHQNNLLLQISHIFPSSGH